jgi:hypothetical protein
MAGTSPAAYRCSARLPGQSGWRAVMAAGGSARAGVSTRRSPSGGRYRSAVCQAGSAGSAAGIPAAVTSNGRTEDRAVAAPVAVMPDSAFR